MFFYVIGNGFDCHYKLQTNYRHFKRFLIDNGHGDLVEKVDSLFANHGFSPDEVECWSIFEDMLSVFCDLDAEEIYDEAMSNAENDDERADYWDSPAWNVDYYNEYIAVLKKQFDLWIRSINTQIQKDDYFHPQPGDCVLNFNYTTTIEDNFDVNNLNIVHIHGTIGHQLILGHNEYHSPNLFTIIEDEDSDYRDTSARKAVNKVLETASLRYYKNSSDILKKHKKLFASISAYDKVVIMGLSCGDQDAVYIQEVLRHANSVDFYFYDDTARQNMENYAAAFAVEVNYIQW